MEPIVKEEAAAFPITSWSEEDRPREKLMSKGKAALSDAELLAILLGSGVGKLSAVDLGKDIMNRAGNNLNQLARFGIKELTRVKGIGPAKAITIMAAMELGRRRKEQAPAEKPRITCSADAYEIIRPHLMDLQHEEFWIILLNRANMVLNTRCISKGGVSGTVADPKLIFKEALDHTASAVILSHNHPSGNRRPSDADIRLTKKVKEAGKLLDMPVLDHIIYTDNSYYSFADEGMM